jgi:hypothetical protein
VEDRAADLQPLLDTTVLIDPPRGPEARRQTGSPQDFPMHAFTVEHWLAGT